MKQKLNRKGFNLNMIMPIALVFVVTGIAVAYGLQVMGDVATDMCTYGRTGFECNNATGGVGSNTNPDSFNATISGIQAVQKIPAKFGLLVTVVIASIVLVILVRYLAGGQR